jgi:23S rRNA pseudouridine2605 synthase
MERLQKILSRAGVASRRAAEKLMIDGRVSVNHVTVRELGTKANPATDDIRVDGRRITLPDRHIYLLLNKPAGYVTTRSDPQRRPTVLDLLPGVREYVYPVGRLDFDSEGLLLITNDGALAAQLTHPRHGVPRVYEARLLGVPTDRDLTQLARGILLDGQKTAPAHIERLRVVGGRTTVRLTLREGRNRQVRRMCEAIGHPVEHLRRVAIGLLRDSGLKLGQCRSLTEQEIARLRAQVAREPTGRPSEGRPVSAKGTAARRSASREGGRSGRSPGYH